MERIVKNVFAGIGILEMGMLIGIGITANRFAKGTMPGYTIMDPMCRGLVDVWKCV